MQINNLSGASIPNRNDFVARQAESALSDKIQVPSLLSDKKLDGSKNSPSDGGELKEAFQNFVGQTLFGEMLKSMRSTVGKSPYFHGGQTEEIFSSQLDQVLSEELTKSSAAKYSDPMFELFQLNQRR